MKDEENKMYSNLADLLNKTLENGEIPSKLIEKNNDIKENEETVNLKKENLIKNKQKNFKKTFKILLKNKKTTQNNYTILHKYTENIQFPIHIQNALTTLDIAYPFSKFQLKQKYRKLCKKLHPDKNNANNIKITIQTSDYVYNSVQLDIKTVNEAYSTLIQYFFKE